MTSMIEMPPRIARLPRDKHDRPVPWFVAWPDGQPDHRIALGERFSEALRFKLCWVCGGFLGANLAFVIGPMCAVNRVTAEPPCHLDCAVYSAQACPFLTTPRMRRRESGKPEGTTDPAGEMIRRNPGVALVWVTRSYRLERAEGGVLFRIGDPTQALWFAEGREATRAEVLEAIESGLPILRASAEEEGPAAVAELEAMTAATMPLVPVATQSHTHRWALVADHIVNGFIVADAHECETCTARKWSGEWPRALEGGRPPIFAEPRAHRPDSEGGVDGD